MEAKVSGCVGRRIVLAALLGAGLALPAAAQMGGGQLEWSNEGLDLRFSYPAELIRQDPAEAMKDEHLMVYGIPGGQVRELADATHCLRPLLSVELPSNLGVPTQTETKLPDGSTKITIRPALLGAILLAEFDMSCMTPEQQALTHDEQSRLLSLLAKVPGMHATLQPTMYLLGKQKVVVAGAQGLPKVEIDSGLGTDPLLSYTMGFTTMWNNHLLVWYLSANNSQVLNRLTKSMVKFGKAQPAVLYPVSVGYVKK